jgi:hypothetical protein
VVSITTAYFCGDCDRIRKANQEESELNHEDWWTKNTRGGR